MVVAQLGIPEADALALLRAHAFSHDQSVSTTARAVVDRLLARGILSKDTHGTVVRIAPPLIVARDDLAWAVGEIAAALRDLEGSVRTAA
jgi:acetylornithine/succinyldiaminopimelate/putrescine aminotransferase